MICRVPTGVNTFFKAMQNKCAGAGEGKTLSPVILAGINLNFYAAVIRGVGGGAADNFIMISNDVPHTMRFICFPSGKL